MVTAPRGTVVGPFHSGYTYDLKKSLSVRADPRANVASVTFKLDGALLQTENIRPYCVVGDPNNSVNRWKPALGSHVLVATPYSAIDGGGTAGTPVTVRFTVVNTSPTTHRSIVRINCGGPAVTDKLGQVWSADTNFVGGAAMTYDTETVSGAKDVALFQSQRCAPTLIYRIPVSNGDYEVTLRFAEMRWRPEGERVFNVAVEGETVLSNLDINALVGRYAAVKRTFPVSVTDGVLNVVGTAIVDQAMISAIEIAPADSETPQPDSKSGLLNVSTRAHVGTGENVLIGGFIITGDAPKKVLIRAIGPSLLNVGVTGVLLNPVVHLHDSAGKLIPFGQKLQRGSGGIDLPASDPREPVMVATLDPGNYTVVLSGRNDTAGVAVLEVYDVGTDASHVAAISTRGKVGTGDNVLIGGFIIGGDEPGHVIVRAVGPSLSKNGIAGALQDPTLDLYDRDGTLIFANDNWRNNQERQLTNSGIAPQDNREAAIAATLAPGNYTAVVRGRHESTGVGLVEVYFTGQ